MSISKSIITTSILPLVFAVTSCSSTKKNEQSVPQQEPTPSVANNTPAAAEPAAKVEIQNPEPSSELKSVYFDFNKYDIRADQNESANLIVDYLKKHPSAVIQIQGNTDDRGSAEYNIALGQKRAQSLKNYLITHGVEHKSIETISYGKEHPAVQGNNEEAWSKNRRDDVVKIK